MSSFFNNLSYGNLIWPPIETSKALETGILIMITVPLIKKNKGTLNMMKISFVLYLRTKHLYGGCSIAPFDFGH